MSTCDTQGCEREVYIKKRQLCRACYLRWWWQANPDKAAAYRKRSAAKGRPRQGPKPPTERPCGTCKAVLVTTPKRTCDACIRERKRREHREAHHRRKNSEQYKAWRRAAKVNRRGRMKTGQAVPGAMISAMLASATDCPICGIEMDDSLKQVDHIRPLVAGGQHEVENLRVVCGPCNNARPRDGRDLIFS